jgi:hypothetical protein
VPKVHLYYTFLGGLHHKSNIDKLEKQVKALADKADNLATKKSYHDLDAKLEAVISANNLKKKAG